MQEVSFSAVYNLSSEIGYRFLSLPLTFVNDRTEHIAKSLAK